MKKKILLIDDDEETLLLLKKGLDDNDFCCVACSRGKEAIDICRSEMPDLLLMDIAMPEVDGISFLSMVRNKESCAGVLLGEGVPIIMVTAHPESFMTAFKYGCDDYIVKPVDSKKLIEKIKEVLQEK